MSNEEYGKKILHDFEYLSKIVGGAQELSDRGWKDKVWCDELYKEEIDKLYMKYLPDEANNFVPITTDDYLAVEDKLMTYLREELKQLIR